MVGEISHIVYAARLLSFLGEEVSHASYWNGVTFPNIRKLHVRTRHFTHPHPVSIASLTGSNDFLTGMRVHAWIDETHDRFERHQTIAEHIPDHPLVPYARSLAEDELLYDAFLDWDVIQKALRTVHHDELYYVHERASVRKWHDVLQAYFLHKPNNESRMIFSRAIGLSHAVANEANATVQALLAMPEIHQVLEGYLRDIEHTIT
ncbi:MAG: hypothetical protein A3E36_00960 [Candidatus Andersenbacteria bacterium RIFCSPHIGHO2_12_FULL_45_11b]|uniref:Uncharacterized protein n=1 Tax=Candidatus Andersenbacteria bacterium RIFCSPHIGHO2_12_FULL_45_11b TaxID=1797282 RepID=A0A1G1XB15_9BACT|nr:MAG: hypothetical protein A3E36_00960 [Candidatus Andersenbacteria bacterium RIFCSPHIGHO2_12_FULL_45_11b]